MPGPSAGAVDVGGVGRGVGNSGSPSIPHPGHVATPVTVLVHAADEPAATSHVAATATLTPDLSRETCAPAPEYALSDGSYASDSQVCQSTSTLTENTQDSFSPPGHGWP